MIAACAPSVDRLVRNHDLKQTVQPGSGFQHLVLSAPRAATVKRLHVYIEGDGSPWVGGRYPARDPTPETPLALQLMTRDAAASVYVGRPCYFGVADAACTTGDWTAGRYSQRVVSSMASAIARESGAAGNPELLLIGYSGGGAIARLVAPDLPNVVAVVTVAANLDTDAWTEYHEYLPLVDSINPATAPPLPERIVHIQLVGQRDDVVPPAVTESYQRSGQLVEAWAYPDFDHRCCWVEAWPDILLRVHSSLDVRRDERG